MTETKYKAKNTDEDEQIRIESIKVFCPNCGQEAPDMERGKRIPPRIMALLMPSLRIQQVEQLVD